MNAVILLRKSAFIFKKIFFDTYAFLTWAQSHFFNDIKTRRHLYNYHGEALLILDGFGPLDNESFLDYCSQNGVIVFPLPSHSSDQCQCSLNQMNNASQLPLFSGSSNQISNRNQFPFSNGSFYNF